MDSSNMSVNVNNNLILSITESPPLSEVDDLFSDFMSKLALSTESIAKNVFDAPSPQVNCSLNGNKKTNEKNEIRGEINKSITELNLNEQQSIMKKKFIQSSVNKKSETIELKKDLSTNLIETTKEASAEFNQKTKEFIPTIDNSGLIRIRNGKPELTYIKEYDDLKNRTNKDEFLFTIQDGYLFVEEGSGLEKGAKFDTARGEVEVVLMSKEQVDELNKIIDHYIILQQKKEEKKETDTNLVHEQRKNYRMISPDKAVRPRALPKVVHEVTDMKAQLQLYREAERKEQRDDMKYANNLATKKADALKKEIMKRLINEESITFDESQAEIHKPEIKPALVPDHRFVHLPQKAMERSMNK